MEAPEQLLKSIDGHDISVSMDIQGVFGGLVKFQARLNSNAHAQKNSPKSFYLLYRHISPGTGMRTTFTNNGSIAIGLHLKQVKNIISEKLGEELERRTFRKTEADASPGVLE